MPGKPKSSRRPGSRISRYKRGEAIRRVNGGEPVAEVAASLHLPQSTIYTIVREARKAAGLGTLRDTHKKQKRAELRRRTKQVAELYQTTSTQAIAEKLGLSEFQVYRAARMAGLEKKHKMDNGRAEMLVKGLRMTADQLELLADDASTVAACFADEGCRERARKALADIRAAVRVLGKGLKGDHSGKAQERRGNQTRHRDNVAGGEAAEKRPPVSTGARPAEDQQDHQGVRPAQGQSR